MRTQRRERILLGVLIAIGAGVFCTGITWGLPSRSVDRFLFGDRTPWSGERIQQLAGDRPDDPARGADVDVDPLTGRDRIIPLNATDAQRARIIRRYRLYTYQPDEMITMMSLASMSPGEGDLDPKLYQYGGLWVYPVGALLKLGSIVGVIHLTSDKAYYLDHPEAFGRFYVAARLYVVAWALLGVWAVFAIVRRLTGGSLWAMAAGTLCYVVMPVVVNMAHEAKPHLPAAVLMLWAVLAAMRYVESGARRWWIATSILCGAAFGMVLSAWPVFVVIPVMMLMRKRSWRDALDETVAGGAIGGAVYLLTNPYIAINVFVNREVLRSNFGNSLAMYEITRLGEGLVNAAVFVGEGASWLLALTGACGALILGGRWLAGRDSVLEEAPEKRRRQPAHGWLLAAPGLLILVQFVLPAAGKPGEYGRFAVFPDVALGITAVTACSLIRSWHTVRRVSLIVLVAAVFPFGGGYLVGFVRATGSGDARTVTADVLDDLSREGKRSLAVWAEPAPYIMPPANLFEWNVLLLPRDYTVNLDDVPADVVVGLHEHFADLPRPPGGFRTWRWSGAGTTSISWANPRLEILFEAEAVDAN